LSTGGKTGGREEESVKFRDFFKRLWPGTARPTPGLDQSPSDRSSSAEMKSAEMKSMLVTLAQTQTHELSCDDVYALLDVFAERVNRGDDAAQLMPLVQHHLEMCPDCREELVALLRSMEATTDEA
jgi:hypothetical protein